MDQTKRVTSVSLEIFTVVTRREKRRNFLGGPKGNGNPILGQEPGSTEDGEWYAGVGREGGVKGVERGMRRIFPGQSERERSPETDTKRKSRLEREKGRRKRATDHEK